MLPAETIFFLMTGAALAGIVMGLVGFGTGLAALGFWLFVVEPTLAVPLVGVCSLTTTAFTLKAYKHAIRLDRLAPFFLGAVFGLPLGIMLLTRVDPCYLQIGDGPVPDRLYPFPAFCDAGAQLFGPAAVLPMSL